MSNNSGDPTGQNSPSLPDVWGSDPECLVHVYVRSPWQWVMDHVSTDSMIKVSDVEQLPSFKLAKEVNRNGADNSLTPSSGHRRRRTTNRTKGPGTLKLEICTKDGSEIIFAAHGNSTALDGLEDKDEMVRTAQRCRCDHLQLSPPSILISWDVSLDECRNVIGKELPALKENTLDPMIAVLKEPMGSQGQGIYFVKTVEDIHKVIDVHRQRALNEPGFLDNLIAKKGRIPSWVLQAEVYPSLLIRNRRKFHIRTYLVVLERVHTLDLVDIYLFNRHEVRIAGVPVKENDTERDRLAHITNGALSNTTERTLLSSVEELTSRGIQEKIDKFVAEAFSKHYLPDFVRRISHRIGSEDAAFDTAQKFAVAGLDLMVTEQNQIYLLEVNVNPASPRLDTVSDEFREHLEGFMRDLVDLVVGKPVPTFLNAKDIIDRR